MNKLKPNSPACQRNRDSILEVLQIVFRGLSRVLEIGSGTGQHAVYFAESMPWLTWQTSDLLEMHGGINLWIEASGLKNVLLPIELEVSQFDWPTNTTDGVFSANTAHIISWQKVRDLFNGVSKILTNGGVFCLYGPFNYKGHYTSKSNEEFDRWLKQRDLNSGIRDFEAVSALAFEVGLTLTEDFSMPANNRLLVCKK